MALRVSICKLTILITTLNPVFAGISSSGERNIEIVAGVLFGQ